MKKLTGRERAERLKKKTDKVIKDLIKSGYVRINNIFIHPESNVNYRYTLKYGIEPALKSYAGRKKYRTETISNGDLGRQYVHILKWETFVGPIPEDKRLTFINGDKSDVKISNLKLSTHNEISRETMLKNWDAKCIHNKRSDISKLTQKELMNRVKAFEKEHKEYKADRSRWGMEKKLQKKEHKKAEQSKRKIVTVCQYLTNKTMLKNCDTIEYVFEVIKFGIPEIVKEKLDAKALQEERRRQERLY